MLGIKLIRNEPDFARRRLATCGAGDDAKVDELPKLDEQRRKILAKVENLNAQRNCASKKIGARMGRKKTAEDWCPAKRCNESRRAQLSPVCNARIK
ncbi:MAG: hypothetical protein ABSD57_08905 [Verrucomicrobiota bacterium]